MPLLPENKPMEKDVTPKVFFIWGQSMHGKTYLARQFPNPIILNTDGNGKKINTPHVDIFDFETFVNVLREIEEGKHSYETIVVDLIDDIKTFLEDYICKKFEVENLADDRPETRNNRIPSQMLIMKPNGEWDWFANYKQSYFYSTI